MKEGWGFTARGTKYHYFVEGTSLCRKWGWRIKDDDLEPYGEPSPDDCIDCKRRLEKRIAAKEKE